MACGVTEVKTHTYIHGTYIHTYIHTFIHTYILLRAEPAKISFIMWTVYDLLPTTIYQDRTRRSLMCLVPVEAMIVSNIS